MKAGQSWHIVSILVSAGLVSTGLVSGMSMAPSQAVTKASITANTELTNHADTIAQTANTAPAITTSSSLAAIALAKHLKSIGAKMYGAYWCPHCHEQLQLFGREAVRQLPYIECAEDGKNARPDLCNTAKVEGYPTWKIKGKTYLGVQPLKQLAIASGYKEWRNLK